nr:DUF3293 domain-containing protein [Saprospiraceae bacterium]
METDCDQKLIIAYYQTSYRVPELDLTFRLGRKNSRLERWCEENQIQSWAFITAWNPQSEKINKTENKVRNSALKKLLEEGDFRYWKGLGVPDKSEDWDSEQSFWVVNIDLQEAVDLGNLFHQRALVYGRVGIRPSLIWL